MTKDRKDLFKLETCSVPAPLGSPHVTIMPRKYRISKKKQTFFQSAGKKA